MRADVNKTPKCILVILFNKLINFILATYKTKKIKLTKST